MKAGITPDGILVVTAETYTEAYALRCWWSRYASGDKASMNPSGLKIDTMEDEVKPCHE